jgi:uncharacterized protein (DUF2267 family)
MSNENIAQSGAVTTALLQTIRAALAEVRPAVEALLHDELAAAYRQGFRDGADRQPPKD